MAAARFDHAQHGPTTARKIPRCAAGASEYAIQSQLRPDDRRVRIGEPEMRGGCRPGGLAMRYGVWVKASWLATSSTRNRWGTGFTFGPEVGFAQLRRIEYDSHHRLWGIGVLLLRT